MQGLLLTQMFATLAHSMARRPRRDMHLILLEAQQALSMTQREFGNAVGSSHRSAVRWAARQSEPAEHHLRTLAGLLYPHDRALAAEVADFIDETLVSLELETPPLPQPPPLPPAPPPVRAEDLVDVLVLAAVENTGAHPATMRGLLHAIFKRAGDVGLTVDAAEKGLRARIAAAKAESAAGVAEKGREAGKRGG